MRTPSSIRESHGLLPMALLVCILATAAILRFHDLDRTSLWYDEAVSWSQSNGTMAHLLASVSADNYPPLHNLLLWATIPLVGDGETALRFPSAVLGLFAVWMMYLIGCRIGGSVTGLLAAAFLALSPFQIWYSTEARMYALLAATGLVFLWSVLRLLDRPSAVNTAAMAIGTALFLYSHIYALFGVAGAGTVCLGYALADLRRVRWKAWPASLAACSAMAAGGVLFLPWLLILLDRAQSVASEGFWIAYPDAPFLFSMTKEIAGSHGVFWMLAAAACVALLPFLKFGNTNPEQDRGIHRARLVCAGYTLGPVLLAYAYSVLIQPILFDRYLSAAWPGLLVLAAAGISALIGRIGSVLAVAVVLYLTFPVLNWTVFEKIRPEWRTIAEMYQEASQPGDRLLLYKGFAAPALKYYLRQRQGFEAVATFEDLKPILPARESAQSTWLLLVHTSPEELSAIEDLLASYTTERVGKAFGWGASGLTLVRIPPAQ